MASRGRGRRGRPRGTGQAPPTFDQPPIFDQQAFVEAVGVATAAIAQASIAGSQGSPSKLQRFRAHHPPTFTGGGGGGGTRWWQTIGLCRSRTYWRLWRSPPIRPGSG